MSDPNLREPNPRQPACPVCGKPAAAKQRPFCSGRCADVDLQGWLSGRYAIPVADNEGETPENEEGGS